MTRSGKRTICVVLVIVMGIGLLCAPASASTRSSEYLASYSASVLPDPDGRLVISASVNGRGTMTELGVKTIFLYESADGKSFQQVKTYESSQYPNMMGSGAFFCEDLFVYQGKVGYYYFASVYVYAGKDGMGDTRNYTTTTVKAIA